MMAKKRTKVPKPKGPRTLPSDAVLAVDPGAKFGAALFVRGRLVELWAGKQTIVEVACISAMAGNMTRNRERDSRGLDPDDDLDVSMVLVIENQFQGAPGPRKPGAKSKPKPFNPKAIASLIKRRHEWEIVAELRGFPFGEAIYPATWQTILKESPAVGGTTKEKSMALATKRWPDFEFTEDGADAACLGLWYCRQQLVEHVELRHR